MVVAAAFREAAAAPPKHLGNKEEGTSIKDLGGNSEEDRKNNHNEDNVQGKSSHNSKKQLDFSATIENKAAAEEEEEEEVEQKQQPLRTSYDFRTQTRKFWFFSEEGGDDKKQRTERHKAFFNYMRALKKDTLASIFKPEGSLDCEMLSKILVCLRDMVNQLPRECLSILNEVSKAGRITLTIMMISSKAETALEEILGILTKNPDNVIRNSAQKLRVALDL